MTSIVIERPAADPSPERVVLESNRRYRLRPADGAASREVYLTGIRPGTAHGIDPETGRRITLSDPETLVREGRLVSADATTE